MKKYVAFTENLRIWEAKEFASLLAHKQRDLEIYQGEIRGEQRNRHMKGADFDTIEDAENYANLQQNIADARKYNNL